MTVQELRDALSNLVESDTAKVFVEGDDFTLRDLRGVRLVEADKGIEEFLVITLESDD